jgi:hypothetical protein
MPNIITHECGFRYELTSLCPQCGDQFCYDDAEQALRNSLLTRRQTDINTTEINELHNRVEDLEDELEELTIQFNALSLIVHSCKKCMKETE